DMQTKVNMLRKFIQRGDKVKLTLMFRGRQIIHPELGEKVIVQIIERVGDIASLEGTIQKQGRFINAILVANTSSTPSPVKPKIAIVKTDAKEEAGEDKYEEEDAVVEDVDEEEEDEEEDMNED
ncbi:translation initiation factor IF-3 C-terminal domain-containing protein, partial [Candidatus Sumerlaeota bacterium]|nr:translation initiation factor IF-3 C-terminal domain-containing protein [Candidatus Sumerlaeota bacterium]